MFTAMLDVTPVSWSRTKLDNFTAEQDEHFLILIISSCSTVFCAYLQMPQLMQSALSLPLRYIIAPLATIHLIRQDSDLQHSVHAKQTLNHVG